MAGKGAASRARGSIMPVPPASDCSRRSPAFPSPSCWATARSWQLATTAPADWTKAVLEERKRVGVK